MSVILPAATQPSGTTSADRRVVRRIEGGVVGRSATSDPDAVAKSARDFATIAYTELLTPLLATSDTSAGPFGGGSAEKTLQPFWLAEIAKRMAENDGTGQGLGLTALISTEMNRMQGLRHDAPPEAPRIASARQAAVLAPASTDPKPTAPPLAQRIRSP